METRKAKLIADIQEMSFEQMRIEFMRFSPTYQMLNQWQGAPFNTSDDYVTRLKAAIPLNVKRGVHAPELRAFSEGQARLAANLYESAELAYAQYGNINMPYEYWWEERGHLIYDSPTNKSSIMDLGTIDLNDMDGSSKKVCANLATLNDAVGSRLHLILSVPMYSTYRDAMSQISKFLRENLFAHADQPRLRKQLHGKRHRDQPLLKKLKLLMYKCLYPEASLSDIGIMANISPSNERILENERFSNEEKAVARRRIGLREPVPEIRTVG